MVLQLQYILHTVLFQADYGMAQKTEKELTVTTYFNCADVTWRSLNPGIASLFPHRLTFLALFLLKVLSRTT